MSGVQGSLFDAQPNDGWKVFLARDYPDIRRLALEEAYDRLSFHESKRTHQTSQRDGFPRNLLEEFGHLMGEASLRVLLFRRGHEVDVLNWGDHSPDARQRSREGNVLRGLSVYVPRIEGGDLIVREDEKDRYPEVRFVLVRIMRFGQPQEYAKAYGWMQALKAWNIGSNFGPQGTPLRDPGDRLVKTTRLDPMEALLL